MWGAPAGEGAGLSWGETNLTLQGLGRGAEGGLCILSGGWMLDCFMR